MASSERYDEPRLCYVAGPWAYFTTQPLSEQWGDDWNDPLPEAGTPYEWHERRAPEKPWEIVKVAWDGPFEEPDYDDARRSRLSVIGINTRGVAPWLISESWQTPPQPQRVIWAGTPLSRFIEMIEVAGGKVYVAVPQARK